MPVQPYKGSVYNVIPVSEVLLQDTGNISARDGERFDQHVKGLATLRTDQCVAFMSFLRAHKFPVAFIRQEGPETVRCHYAGSKLDLEVVVRLGHTASSSSLHRNPTLKTGWIIGKPAVEFFHKKTFDTRTSQLVDGNIYRTLGPAEVERLKKEKIIFPDPFIRRDNATRRWYLHDAAAPLDNTKPLLALGPMLNDGEAAEVEHLAVKAAQLLAHAFHHVDCDRLNLPNCTSVSLVDIKFEFAYINGELTLIDAVTLDCLRLVVNDDLVSAEAQLSKQVYRNGASLDKVIRTYEVGTRIASDVYSQTFPELYFNRLAAV